VISPWKAANLAATVPAPGLPPLQPQIEAWTTSQLDGVIWADLIGAPLDALPVSRAAAMAVPAVARARHLIAGTIAKLPLQAMKGAELVPDQPYWPQGSDGQLGDLGDLDPAVARSYGVMPESTWHRTLWTVDDHLFYGVSVWLVTRTDPADGRPTRAVRIPWANWASNEHGQITDLDGRVITDDLKDADDNVIRKGRPVIVIPGPHEGILNFAQRTIRGASDLEQTAADVAKRPFRILLHQTTDITLTPAERAAIVGEARRALRDNDGILFTNAAVEATAVPVDSGALLIDGRNASALDVARDVSMPASMLDATQAGASLTYETAVGRNQQWIDYGLALYMEPITARLSMDDVVPQGQRVVFDDADLTAPAGSTTGPNRTD
jgi:hypothetical protein